MNAINKPVLLKEKKELIHDKTENIFAKKRTSPGNRIVVMEDEKATLQLMEIALEESGYDVIAINQYEPMDYLMDFDPQLILLDIRLSNGYGHILCEELKTNPLSSMIPVVLVSGAQNLERIAGEYKADGYLSKPFNVDELLECVHQHNVKAI